MVTVFRRRRKYGLVLICLCCVLLSFYGVYRVVSLYSNGEETPNKRHAGGIPIVGQESEETEAVGSSEDKLVDSAIISVNTVLRYRTIYNQCNHINETVHSPNVDLLGLTYDQLINRFPDWTIEKFDEQELLLVSEVEGMCKECLDNSYLGIKDGLVTIFYGKPGRGRVVKKQTSISVSKLPDSEVRDLEQGILVSSNEELYSVLEGLSSLERY